MKQLPSYEENDPQKYCLKLYKSIYGLKQAGCRWQEIVCNTLGRPTDLGFKKCKADPAVLYIDSGKQILILTIHVDNCIVTDLSHAFIQEAQNQGQVSCMH